MSELESKKAQALDAFLRSVQSKAFCHAQFATKNRDDALDIVQDAMLTLAKSYGNKEEAEWPPLFHRVLQNKITDWFRRKKVRQLFFVNTEEDEAESPTASLDGVSGDPASEVATAQLNKILLAQVKGLPAKQQQTFLLRVWWGYDIKETADIMQCTEGTVKTHFFRATEKLKLNATLCEVMDRESFIG